MRDPIVIIGGGLAGMATALALAEAGEKPVLLETRRRLGGRATSFVDRRTGQVLDNCQHVLMGGCTNLIDFYDRLGVASMIRWHRTLTWTSGNGVFERVTPSWLPAPAHLAPAFGRLRLYDAAARRAIRRGVWRILRLGRSGRVAWQDRTFAEFLATCDQPADVVRRFWNTIVVSACNLPVERVAADAALKVFQEGFLANRFAAALGVPTVPLDDLYAAAPAVIEGAGGVVRSGVAARAIAYDGNRVSGVVTNEGLVKAYAVVAAVPFDRLDKLVSDTLRAADPRLQPLGRFEVSPIIAAHLVFETPIMEMPHLVLVDHDFDWIFEKGRTGAGGQHIQLVKSAADAWIDEPETTITQRAVADVHRAFPAARGREPVGTRVIKEKRATFACTPEIGVHRPRTTASGVGGVPNLFLAGDWCDTGWPATMEGAVRSGYAAAAALSDGCAGVIEDAPIAPVARWLGL
ncbi:MAG: FAD-dependent oxidoreductase [Phycisphaerales bacterium]|nr:hydroxysqualene dehydroxylase HpnE [Phycisphaerae bacterium]NNM26052.1 FAD-dependent oxidoreductase [Phycisphaerales bacterium]